MSLHQDEYSTGNILHGNNPPPDRHPEGENSGLRNLRLTIAYDGAPYQGWQIQKHGPSIQGMIESAVFSMTGENSVVECSGRTDTGVHAVGQVANFKTRSKIPAGRFRLGLQSYLPADIVILEVCQVPLSFHARFQAKRKRYRYLIDNHPAPLPFLKKYAWHYHVPLDVNTMHRAAQALIGTRDFRSFESHWPNKLSSVRTIFEIAVCRLSGWHMWHQKGPFENSLPTGEEGYIALDVVGDGFLYNMVRSIMGTLVDVGRGKTPEREIERVLEALDRRQAGMTAPAHGLYLMSVEYDD